MTQTIAEALDILAKSDLEGPPTLPVGQEENKRDRKAREKRNAEHEATTTLVAEGFSLAARIAVALEEIAERGREPRNG
jgi:hypothetical protein